MKKAIALIPFVARRRRRSAAERGAKLSAPALIGGGIAAIAIVVRRRRRSAAGFDASPSELGGDRPAPKTAPPTAGDATPERAERATEDQPEEPPAGQGRSSTLEGDPADSVPKAGVAGVGENAVIPDTSTDDPAVRQAEAAAAAEAGAIGGDVPDTPPSNSGDSFESFSERES